MKTVISEIAMLLQAIENCKKAGNNDWLDRHEEKLEGIIKNRLPSGSGWDSGTKLDEDRTKIGRIVFYGAFHHMDDYGYYDGWTNHSIIVTSTFSGIDVRVTGNNKNDIKEYLGEMFDYCLSEPMEKEPPPDSEPLIQIREAAIELMKEIGIAAEFNDKADALDNCAPMLKLRELLKGRVLPLHSPTSEVPILPSYVIRSTSEQAYWSNTDGWVYTHAEAERFTAAEKETFNLPMSKGNDAEWVDIHHE